MARTELFSRKQPGGMFAVVNQSLTTGNIYFVNATTGTNASGYGLNPDAPFASVAYALTQVTANQGDRIYVMPGHTEAIADATSFAAATAGVQVIGLGAGSARPTITIGTANTATVAVSADNVSFENMIFTANFLSIAAAFTLSTAKNFALRNCKFTETSNVLNFLNIVKSTGAANTVDGLTVTDCNWNGLGTTSVNALILSANDVDSLTVLRNVVKLARTADSAMIVITAGVLTNLDCGENKLYTAQTATSNGSLINVGGTTSTGFVYSNRVQTLTTSADKLFTTTVGLAAFENRVTGVVGATGFVIPAVDS
jgi:hypothetical protein